MKKYINKNTLSITFFIVLFLGIIFVLIWSIPSKQIVTKINHVTVQKAKPVKIASFDVDLDYHGNQSIFEDALDHDIQDLILDTQINRVYFNEYTDNEINVPNSYFNPDSDNAVETLFHKPYFVGQNYYANNTHPAIKVTTKNTNIFGKRLKNRTEQYNIWPNNLKIGMQVSDSTFISENKNPLNYHTWDDDYQISVNPNTHRLTWKEIE